MTLSSTISEHAIIDFASQVQTRVQQKKSRLQPYVTLRPFKGKAMAYDGVGSIELGLLQGRHQAVEFSDMEHWRRKITRQRFGATLPIDATDVEERLTDPQGVYVEALANAARRQMDRVIVAVMFASVLTGEDFDTTVTYANDGGLTVDATAGLVYEKLLEIIGNFIDNEVGNDEETKICMGITGDEHTDLMSELELVSGDYSREYVVDKGRIQKAAGIDLIRFAANGAGGAAPILPVAAAVRTSFAMAEGAICVGISRTWDVKVDNRPDLYDTKQVQMTGVLGAVRTEGKLIQKVTFTE